MVSLKFDVNKYPFANIVKSWFSCDDLYKLHTYREYELFKRETDQSSHWHDIFYSKVREDSIFNDAYVKFLCDVIKPRYNGAIIYQKIPTFRVHFPNNVSVGEFHKDKHYRDVEWAEKVKETNYYLPLTSAYRTNTIWVESKENLGDHSPMTCSYGECVEWDASNLMHGNKINIEDTTRVSFDFRIIPKERYISSNYLTINTKIKFDIGGYYEELS